MVRDILGYLSRTKNFGITLKGSPAPLQLQQYCDASFATGRKGRSISGCITLLNGSPITWQSHQQTSVATSTAHSEYIAAYEAALQVIPLQDLLEEVAAPYSRIEPPKLLVDNSATLSTANSGILTRQNRHFVTKYHWLHEQIDTGKITPEWVLTKE